jgi:hypothetical protein
MVAFFDARSAAVLACAFLQFGAAIVLGLFTVSVVSQLKYLGVKAAGTGIALFGGLLSAFNIMAGTIFLWTMTYPGIAQERQLLHALYRLTFAFGGIGFSVPCGLLFAGVSVTSGIYKLLPKWIVILGLIVAVIGELSWFEMLTPRVLMLIPLTRFPGFVWLIAAGFALPKTRKRGVTAWWQCPMPQQPVRRTYSCPNAGLAANSDSRHTVLCSRGPTSMMCGIITTSSLSLQLT